MTDVSVEFNFLSGETFLHAKIPLVVGGTRMQVFADNTAILASSLNHCATKTFAQAKTTMRNILARVDEL